MAQWVKTHYKHIMLLHQRPVINYAIVSPSVRRCTISITVKNTLITVSLARF